MRRNFKTSAESQDIREGPSSAHHHELPPYSPAAPHTVPMNDINRDQVYCIALYDFIRFSHIFNGYSEQKGDLSLRQGDRILVLQKDGDWWIGVVDGRQGSFPSNYVRQE